ncbi:hypothetical protein TREMEDRAFT_56402 [Tremella mesenterica DSM 1558]|nr:uncharacterized protein TREMEDRAFT_56402 [Tremella mesenterica DSM 1558]EIW71331.1 hypothetical protein TREMEDRAFT_56402 [Tremella mesenterica DSM 1558]
MGAVPPHPMRSQTMPDYQFNYQVTDTSQLGFDNMSMDTSNQFIYSNPPTMPMLLGNNGRAHSDPSMPPSGLSAEDDFFFQLSDNPDFQLIAQT